MHSGSVDAEIPMEKDGRSHDDNTTQRIAIDPTISLSQASMRQLVEVVQALSLARGLDQIVETVRHAARQLTNADGATFVLRDGAFCYYVDEDAISPLWKGQRFPIEACISGWAMLNGRSTIVPDIYQDSRIPHAAYQPTFVRSLVMVPIRTAAPIGAIGNYWAAHHECTPEELLLLEMLANTTSVAMENVSVYQDLENQVRQRTQQLELANRELEAFTSAVSHDLRAPLRAINMQLELNAQGGGGLNPQATDRIRDSVGRMSGLIDDLLRLSRIGRAELSLGPVDLAKLAAEIMERLRCVEPQRSLTFVVAVDGTCTADAGLMNVLLENLLSNAWKYSSRREHSRIEFTSSPGADGRTVYCVRDNGAGFNPQYVDRLFQPFARLHDAREFSGTGIGLATVQRIVERHGGRVWANSDGVSGAEFCFTLG